MPVDSETRKVMATFLDEAREAFQEIEPTLVELESLLGTDEVHGVINRVFGVYHSVKGGAGLLEFNEIERVTHAAESVLQKIRDDELDLDESLVDLLCKGVDFVNDRLDAIEQTWSDKGAEETADELVSKFCVFAPEIDDRDEPGILLFIEGDIVVVEDDGTGEVIDDPRELRDAAKPIVIAPVKRPNIPAELPSDVGDGAPHPTPEPPAKAATPAAPPPRPKKHETLRVDVEKVDRLMDLVGELIIGVTSVVHHPDVTSVVSDQFEKATAQLNRVTRDMQDVAMSLRMVPVSNTFRKMRRLVRDLSKKLGKRIRLEITGEDTEVDKSVAEVIADPLVHLVRNSLDHALEPPEERAAAGKPPVGLIHLTARHQGGEVWIEIIDDGRGINKQKVYQRALDRGITDRTLSELSDREVNTFIFEPGFSTAHQVSEVSGRGMGMDVVRRNIESVNGRIEVDSTEGLGTRVSLRIPLTLAIIEGMLVRVGQSCFTIPLLQIRESMVVRTEDVTILSNGQEIVRIREQLLPLVRMHQFYDIESDVKTVGQGIVMVVEDAGVPLCLFVDELIGQRQTVIKGLSGYLRAIRGLSGCTVLGDGRISFILDVASLRSHAVAQGVA